MTVLRAGISGLGFVGRAHLDALRRLGVRVVGAVPGTTDSSRVTAETLGLRVYTDFDALLDDPTVDVVHIATPNHLHHPMAHAALEAGKHVVCEKPLALTSKETKALTTFARKKGLVGAVCYNLRYYPLCHQARSLVRAGEIGAPRIIHGSYLQDWLLWDTDWNWRLETKAGGNLRVVADIGTHWMDLAAWISGDDIAEVCADLATIHPERKRPRGSVQTFAGKTEAAADTVSTDIITDDYASILLGFKSGARGALTVSQVSPGRKNRLWLEVDGSRAAVSWDSESPNRLWIGRRNEPNFDVIKDPALMHPAIRRHARYPGGHAEGYPDTFLGLFSDIYEYIGTGDLTAPRPFPDFFDGHIEAVLCEAILESHRDRRWITVPER